MSVCGVRVGSMTSFRVVSFRFVWYIFPPVIRNAARVNQQYPGPVCWCSGALYYPWQGRENTRDGNAGRAAEAGRGHSMQAVRRGLCTRRNTRAVI
jgi:hypothetical protein